MKNKLRLLFTLLLVTFLSPACTGANHSEASVQADLPDLGPAPELSGKVWLNTDTPLHLADLRGKVVLVDMWTFS